MMAENLVLYETRTPAVLITLNRPDRRNALSRELISAMSQAFDCAANDAAARCVILTGAGTVFCAGMDLAELAQSLNTESQKQDSGSVSNEAAIWDDAARLARLYDLIYRLPKPTIAAVNGAA